MGDVGDASAPVGMNMSGCLVVVGVADSLQSIYPGAAVATHVVHNHQCEWGVNE